MGHEHVGARGAGWLCERRQRRERTDTRIAKIPLPDPDAKFVVSPTEPDGHGVRARYECVVLLLGATRDESEVFAAQEERTASGFPVLQYDEMPARTLFAGKQIARDRPLMAEMLIQLVKKGGGGREKEYFLSWLQDIEEDHRKGIEKIDEAACREAAESVFRLNLLTDQKGIAAFNLAWAGETPTRVTVSFDNPPPGVQLRCAYRSVTVNGAHIADALLVMDDGESIELTPGKVEQVLIIAAPSYPSGRLSLQFQIPSGIKASAAVTVTRSRMKLPEQFDYPIWGWDYLDWPRPYTTAAELAEFLKPYHFNLATLTCVPFRDEVKFDGKGHPLG